MKINEECLDCLHSTQPDKGNYCYMFEKAPTKLPCGQHTKFEKIRNKMGKLILKNPLILIGLIEESIHKTKENIL